MLVVSLFLLVGCGEKECTLTLAEAREYGREPGEILFDQGGASGPYRPTRELRCGPGCDVYVSVTTGPGRYSPFKKTYSKEGQNNYYGPIPEMSLRAQIFKNPEGYEFFVVYKKPIERQQPPAGD